LPTKKIPEYESMKQQLMHPWAFFETCQKAPRLRNTAASPRDEKGRLDLASAFPVSQAEPNWLVPEAHLDTRIASHALYILCKLVGSDHTAAQGFVS
jgi:hypothetical protein